MQKLTDKDTQIIEALRKDPRSTNKGMALTMGVSEETVRRRVNQMVESGALQFDVNVSAEALGMPVSALVNIEVDFGVDPDLMKIANYVHTAKTYETINGTRIYEVAAYTNESLYSAITYLRGMMGVRKASAVLLHTKGDHRI